MKYGHKGNAKSTTLAAGLGAGDLTITGTDFTGWPDGSTGPFWADIDKGQLTEEKVLCSGRSGNVLQVWTGTGSNGRGMDDTVAHDHGVNATIEHVWTATEAEEISAHVNETNGAHGYPSPSNLVTVDGAQDITGSKTLESPTLRNPTFTGTITGLPVVETNIGMVTVTASLTASEAHANKAILASHASTAIVVTLPSNTAEPDLPVGVSIMLVRYGAAAVSFAAGSGATVLATPGLNLRSQNSMASAIKVAANTWLVSGDVTV